MNLMNLFMRRRYLIEISETAYRELEEEAQSVGLSVPDLHRRIYKTYFGMMALIRSEDSELVVRTEGKETILMEDRFYTLDELLGED